MTKSTITREQITSWMNDANHTLEEPLNADDAAGARAILAMGHELLAAMDSESAIADCDPEVYEKGVSVCLVAIPKETAEVICQNITAATGCKVDWHYFGGRVHIKALRESSQSAQVVPVVSADLLHTAASAIEDLLEHTDPNTSYYSGVWADVPGKLRAAAPQSPGSDPAPVPGSWIPVSERMPPPRYEVLVGRWWGEKPRWCCKWATYIPGHPDSQSSGWLIPGASWTPTHWMPLPVAPQEV